MTFRWQYQSRAEPLWTGDRGGWDRLPEYPAAYLVPPRLVDEGIIVGQELDSDLFAVTVVTDWIPEPEYPVAYLVPPRPVDVGSHYTPQAIEILLDIDWFPGPEYPAAYLIPPPSPEGGTFGQELDEDFFVDVVVPDFDSWWRPASTPPDPVPNYYWTWPSLFYEADPESFLVVYNRRTMVGHAVLQVASGDTIRVRMKKITGDGTVGLVEDGSSIKITLHDFS
jgi:hypothetical protein